MMDQMGRNGTEAPVDPEPDDDDDNATPTANELINEIVASGSNGNGHHIEEY